MFCRNCGKEINDNDRFCANCGFDLGVQNYDNNTVEEPSKNYNNCYHNDYIETKTGVGALLGVFLGLIGLIIGLCLYPPYTLQRTTFLKGWGIAFGITILVVLILYFSVFASILGALSSI